MEIRILVLMTTFVTIAVGLSPLTKESSAQNDDSYIPGVFILTDNVRKIQDQLKNENHKKEEPATVVTEKEQGPKLQEIYHQDAKANDIPANSRSTMSRSNQAPVFRNHGTNQESLKSNRLYTNQNQAASYQETDPNQHKLYLMTQPLTNQQILPKQPLINQPIVLNHQKYLSNQNLNPSQSFVLSNQQPLQLYTTTTQTQSLPTNQMTTQGLSNQPVFLVQSSQNGQPIIMTQQPNQAVLIQPNQLLQNGQLGQTNNILLASNQNSNQADSWPKPAQNQAVYSLVTLGQNSIPSNMDNHHYIALKDRSVA
ncbi:hypothetical protein K1T71_007406 [Dendrolimus kikuchii]|uniref:Uncharacterized protein n=1 Tax=Dendrolimus kikuchii TaxID=765133 RepID=A0ACC1D1Z7_9NEOP|nr:hypothetical protein K1T71_007406 [Dendrolimus kikuchii]